MEKIDGKKIAQEIIEKLKKLPKPEKMLAAVLVGSTGSPQAARSLSFLRQKEKMAADLGVAYHLYQYDDSIIEADLIKEIKKIGNDGEIGGIIVQLPLPPHYNRDKVLAAINPKKDIDALTLESRNYVQPLPVEVVKDVLEFTNNKLQQMTTAVVGRGFLVGKLIIEWLENMEKPFELFHSKSGLAGLKKADLIITGVGKGGLINPKMLKKGAIVIDFGYDFVDGKIKGDFEPSEDFSGWYTPTPGGTGPILVAEIFKNFYTLNK